MSIGTQADGLGTRHGVGRPGTMWIAVVTVIVVALVAAGLLMSLRSDTATPSKNVVPSTTQGAADAVAPEEPAGGAPIGSAGRRSIGTGSTNAPGGYVLQGGMCRQCYGW